MKLLILNILFVLAAATLFAQNNSPDIYRTATTQEILLHDKVCEILQQEIESEICNGGWAVSNKPLLLRDNPSQKVVVKNYLKGTDNIPVFINDDNRFEISMKPGSTIYIKNEAKIKKLTAAYIARTAGLTSASKEQLATIKAKNERYFKNINRLSNDKQYGILSLEFNQSHSISGHNLGKVIKKVTAPGINQLVLFEQLPDENSADTLYNAILYLGDWPKMSVGQMNSFHFKITETGSDPVIENMIIEISTFHYNKMISMISRIDWTKLAKFLKIGSL
jgi:hypothetical protein